MSEIQNNRGETAHIYRRGGSSSETKQNNKTGRWRTGRPHFGLVANQHHNHIININNNTV
jgi:hypothetical protein